MGEKMSGKKGTYYEIDQLDKRISKLEKTLKEFIESWRPKQPKPGYDIHGNKWPTGISKEDNH